SREASGDRGAAIEAWTKLLAVAPKDEGAHAELIRLLRMQERFDDAEAAYQSAVRSLGRSSDRLLVARARAFFDAGKRDAGIEALVQVPVSNRLLRVLGPLSDQDAAQAAEVLAERHPKNTSLLTYAARRLAHAGDRPRALELLDRALAVDPRDTDMVVAKGEILLEADRLDDLESLLKNAFLTIDAKSPELLSLRAQLLIALERYDEAVRVVVSAEAEDDIQEYVDSLRGTGELQKAEKLVNAAVTQCPGSDSFLRAQGELLLQQRNYQGARQAFHAARVKHPDDTDLLLRETFALRSARMFEEAQQIIDRALRGASRENRPGLLVELGFISYDQGNFEEAAASYDAALAVDPDNGDAYLWKIRALCRSNRRKEAEKVIGQALDRVPIDQALDGVPFDANVHAQIICEMGKMHETREEWEAAVKSYNEALDVDPDIGEVSFSKANVLLRLNRNEEADAIVSTILEQRGSDNDVRENAGFFYLEKKDFPKAETQFQELLRRSDSSIQAINGLGAIYFEQGKFDRAEDKFREVLKVDPSNAGLWTNLAWALVRHVREADNNRESMLADAENNCRKSLELDPNSADAHACLGII